MQNLNISRIRVASSSRPIRSVIGLPLVGLLALAPACGGQDNAQKDGSAAVAKKESLSNDHKFKNSKEVADYVQSEVKRHLDFEKEHKGDPYITQTPEHLIPQASQALDLQGFIALGDQQKVTVLDADVMAMAITYLAVEIEKTDAATLAKAFDLAKKYNVKPRGVSDLVKFARERGVETVDNVLAILSLYEWGGWDIRGAEKAFERHGIDRIRYLKTFSDKYQIPIEDLLRSEWNGHCSQPPGEVGEGEHVYYRKAEVLIRKYKLNNEEAAILLFKMDNAFEAGIDLYGEERIITAIKIASIAYDGFFGFDELRFLVEHGDLQEARAIAGGHGKPPLADTSDTMAGDVNIKKNISMAIVAAELSRDMQIPLGDVLDLMKRHGSYGTRVILNIAVEHWAEFEEEARSDTWRRRESERDIQKAVISKAEDFVRRFGVITAQAISEDALQQGRKLSDYDREDAEYFAFEAIRIGEMQDQQTASAENVAQRRASLEEQYSFELNSLYGAERERREHNMEINAAVRARYSIVQNPLKFLAYITTGYKPEPEQVKPLKFERSDFVRELFEEYGVEAVELGLYLAGQAQGAPARYREIFGIRDQLNAIPVASRYTQNYTAQQVIALLESAPISVFENGDNSEQFIGAMEISRRSMEVYKAAIRLAEGFRDDSSWRKEVKDETEDGYLIVGGALDHYDVYWTARTIIEFGEDNVRAFLERGNFSDGEALYRTMKDR